MIENEKISRRNALRIGGLAALGGLLLEKFGQLSQTNSWENTLPQQDPNAFRILLLGDVHAANYNVNDRQNNTQSVQVLENVVQHLTEYPLNQLIQMGDLVNKHSDETQTIALYEACLHIFQQLPFPTLHLLGNHDVWSISKNNLSVIYQNHHLNPFYGVCEYDKFQIVWLDLHAQDSEPGSLPDERIDWLKQVIYKDTPTFIFSHYGLLPQNVDGNCYFDGNPQLTALTNSKKVLEALEGLPIQAIISAHMHWGSHEQMGNIHMITIPAFIENIAASKRENPGIYSILEITSPQQFTLKAYFGSTCFMRFRVG